MTREEPTEHGTATVTAEVLTDHHVGVHPPPHQSSSEAENSIFPSGDCLQLRAGRNEDSLKPLVLEFVLGCKPGMGGTKALTSGAKDRVAGLPEPRLATSPPCGMVRALMWEAGLLLLRTQHGRGHRGH